MSNNIEGVVVSKDCCGCENCFNVCPQKAITISHDAEGFIYPSINKSKCIDCGLCIKKCPIINVNNVSIGKHNIDSFSCYQKEQSDLLASSSGGLGYGLMLYGITNGIHTFGVRYSNDFCSASYEEIMSLEQINRFRGSKYIQAHKNGVFKTIKNYLNEQKKCLFIGLPCEVGALKCFLGTDLPNLFTVELICHGPTSEKALSEFLHSISKNKAFITSLNLRSKKKGWTPPYLKVTFSDGGFFSKLFDLTSFGYAFRNFSRPSCYNCKYKGDSKCADLTIGDYWGARKNDKCWNSDGVSVCFVHTDKGKYLFDLLRDSMAIFPLTYKEAICGNSHLFKSRSKGKRDAYANSFLCGGIECAKKENETFKEKVIDFLWGIKWSIVKNKH